MKRFFMNNPPETGHARWEVLAAPAVMIIISLLLFYIGLPLWGVVIIQIIGSYFLYLFLKVAFTRSRDST